MTDGNALQVLGAVAGMLGVVAAVWFNIDRKINSSLRLLHKRINDVEDKLTSHKLESLRDYASVSHLEKVEDRLVSAIKELTEKIEGLRECWPRPRSTRKTPD